METRPPIIARSFAKTSYARRKQEKKMRKENLLNICAETVIDNRAADNKKLSLLILVCDNSYPSRTCFTRSVLCVPEEIYTRSCSLLPFISKFII